ncbi:MAG: DUF2603 domain-containing protein [Epsilonproteobacteria bacterium]|nr:DUF2603 domain-containing protein [Campylobacterota bacterium]
MAEEEKIGLANLPATEQFKRIEGVAKRLGVADPQNRPVLQLRRGEKENERVLELKRGSWDDAEPWFVIDEEGRLMVMTSAESMQGMVHAVRHMGEEVFKSRLEKAIARELPVDFHDVWAVAMDRLRHRIQEGETTAAVDLGELVRQIKRDHPNLFYSLKDLEIDEEDFKEAGL